MVGSKFLTTSMLCLVAAARAAGASGCTSESEICAMQDASLLQSAALQKPVKSHDHSDAKLAGSNSSSSKLRSSATPIVVNMASSKTKSGSSVKGPPEQDGLLNEFDSQEETVKELVEQEYAKSKEKLANMSAEFRSKLTKIEAQNSNDQDKLAALKKAFAEKVSLNDAVKKKIVSTHKANIAARRWFSAMKPKVDKLLSMVYSSYNLSALSSFGPVLSVLNDVSGSTDASLQIVAGFDTAADMQRDMQRLLGLFQTREVDNAQKGDPIQPFKSEFDEAAPKLQHSGKHLTTEVQQEIDALAAAQSRSEAALKDAFQKKYTVDWDKHLELAKNLTALGINMSQAKEFGALLNKTLTEVKKKGQDFKDYAGGFKTFAKKFAAESSKFIGAPSLIEMGVVGAEQEKVQPAKKDPPLVSDEFDKITKEMDADAQKFKDTADSIVRKVATQRQEDKKLLSKLQANLSANLSVMDKEVDKINRKILDLKSRIETTKNLTNISLSQSLRITAKIKAMHTMLETIKPATEAAAKFFEQMLSNSKGDNASVFAVVGEDAFEPAGEDVLKMAMLQYRANTHSTADTKVNAEALDVKRSVPLIVSNLSEVTATVKEMTVETEEKRKEIMAKFLEEFKFKVQQKQLLQEVAASKDKGLKDAEAIKNLTVAAKDQLESRLAELAEIAKGMHSISFEIAEAADKSTALIRARGKVNASATDSESDSSHDDVDDDDGDKFGGASYWSEWFSR